MSPAAKKITAAALFIVCFFVYVTTLNPAFHANDSPETITCSDTLGIQHPPGYPLFSLTGKIFSLIPNGSKAFRVNLTAAFFGALAVMLLFLTLLSVYGKKEGGLAGAAVSLSAAAAFAFTFTFWSEALSAKGGIYAMNAFFLILAVFIAFEFERTKQEKYLYLFSLVIGLSFSNHWKSMAVTLPAFLIYFVMIFRKHGLMKMITPGRFFFALFFALAGIFVYAYLPIRSHTAYLNWGNPSTFSELLYVIMRGQYADLEKARSLSVVLMQLKKIGSLLLVEFTIAGLAIAALGVKGFIDTGKKERLILVSTAAVSLLFVLAFYLNLKEEMLWIIDVFMIPVYLCMAFLIAGAFSFLFKLLKVVPFVVYALCAVFPGVIFGLNYKKAGQQGYFYAYDFGMNVIKSIDTPAIAMLEGDFYVMPMMYFKYADPKTDFCPITTLFLYKDWGLKNIERECPGIASAVDRRLNYSGKIASLVNSNLKERHVFVSIFKRSYEEFFPAGNSLLVPSGLMMKTSFNRPGEVINVVNRLKVLSYRNIFRAGERVNSTTALCLSNYASAYMEAGNYLSSLGMDGPALRHLRRGVEIATPPTKGEAWTHLGVQYAKLGENESAIDSYREAVKVKPSLAEAHSNMSGIFNNMKKYDEAIAAATEALKHKPGFSEAYNNMAVSYYHKGDLKKAVELMELAVKHGPNNQAAANNLKILKGGR